ncbi:MAG TPA: sensor histidine kinase, partial [Opitutus sp.]|nr:sensor histidine kinase [Opitutus sp.]
MLALGAANLSQGALPPDALLTTAAQVRGLTEEEARREIPVRLRGVFMGEADPEGIAFVIQDETEGIYIQGPADLVASVTRGDLLEIEGVTDPGGFAPYVVARSVTKVGRGEIPEPIQVSIDELGAGHMDAKWIEVSGIVRSVEPKSPSDNGSPPPGTRYAIPSPESISQSELPKVIVTLASGNTRLSAQVCGKLNPDDYVDAVIRLRGLCFNLHNRNRQFVRPFVQVPRGVEVVMEKAPPELRFSGEPRPVSGLLRFEKLTGKHGHRVHVRGVVTHYQPGAVLWIRDRDHSLRVETTQDGALQLGDEVDVVGFPARGGYSAVLEDAVFRKRASQPPPAPHVLTEVSSALRKDADLVQLEARLVELRRFPDSVALTLDWHHTSIRAQLHLPENTAAPANWLPGSLVQVSGICSVITDEAGPLGGLWEPRSFQLLLRSSSDVSVIQAPPWWNAERVGWVISGLLIVVLGAVAV